MATSQNGWPVITSGTDPRLVAIDKIIGRVRSGDVATIFAYVVARFDAEVEDVDAGADDWGWAYRAIRGSTTGYSNHASGTAIDLNAARHPLGVRGTFTPAQAAAIRRIVAAVNAAASATVLRWGGDYTGRPDEMHLEIIGSVTAVARAAAAIRGGQLVSNPLTGGGSLPDATVTAPTPIEEIDVNLNDPNDRHALKVVIAETLSENVGVLSGGPAAWFRTAIEQVVAETLRKNIGDIAVANPASWWSQGMRALLASDDPVDETELARSVTAALVPAVVDALAAQGHGLTAEQVTAATETAVRNVLRAGVAS